MNRREFLITIATGAVMIINGNEGEGAVWPGRRNKQ